MVIVNGIGRVESGRFCVVLHKDRCLTFLFVILFPCHRSNVIGIHVTRPSPTDNDPAVLQRMGAM